MIRLGNIVLRNASCCATQRFLVPSPRLHCAGPSLQDQGNIHLKTSFAVSSLPQYQPCRLKSTKGKKGKGAAGGKPDIDDLIDALSDDEFEETEPEELKEFKETPLSKLLKSSRKGPPSKGSKKDSGKQGGGPVIKYEMFVRVVDGEKLWQELENVVDNLKQYYIQHLSVRSATSLDNLPVELEGDKYPLNELALISKKDPKRLVIDASSFPQATANIMSAIRDAGMNLNPQQDGLRIFVPIPKVNKEFREKLVVGARKKLNSTKDELRSVQNLHTKRMEESDPPPGVSKDDVKEAVAAVRLITESFIASADQLLGKWTCKDEGEAEAWVILQLEEMSIISDLDLGNNGAAFIEVQVGRLGMEVKDYQTLLVASSFMSPGEARLGDMATRVRMFGTDKLSTAVAKEKWDMVKVVATQPFTKHIRYGIAFVTVSGKTASGAAPSVASTTPTLKLGAFRLKPEEKKEEISVGSLFRRQKEQEAVGGASSVAASLRAEKTLADMALAKAEKEESKRKRSDEGGDEAKKTKKIRPEDGDLPRRDGVPGESRADMFKTFEPKKEEFKSKEKVSNVKHSDIRKERKAKEEDLKERVQKYKNRDIDDGKDKAASKQSDANGKARGDGSTKGDQGLAGKAKSEEGNQKGLNGSKVGESKKPFRDLLRGVVFAISGFQNPLRGEIRGKALEMGAKYEPDWSNRCTHLICAFTNTPKFQQVKALGGKIVKREWVEECHTRRKRLPWRRFCLDRADQGDESEDEVWEQGAIAASNGADAKSHMADAYDQDTDEEVEQLKQRDAKEAEEEKKRLDAEEKKAQEVRRKEMEEAKGKEKLRKANEKKIQQSAEKKEKEAEQIMARQKEHEMKERVSKEVNPFDMETDEEVEEVKVRLEDDHDSAYDADTDVDEDVAEKLRPETKDLDFPNLPSFFSSMQFYMHGDYDKGEDELIKRYIVAFGGKVVPLMKRTVARVITASNWWSDDFEELLKWNPDVLFLRPSWVFACSDQGRLVEEGTHRVRKS